MLSAGMRGATGAGGGWSVPAGTGDFWSPAAFFQILLL